MKKTFLFSGSLQAKFTRALVLSLLFVAAFSDLLIYRTSLKSQFEQLRKNLMAITEISSLLVDADTLSSVPLNKQGVNSPQYKSIAEKLLQIKKANPEILFIYTMAPTVKDGVWQFVVDPEPKPKDNRQSVSSYPGDKYDVSRFPDMSKAFEGASADKKLMVDEWGVTLSGYAPIRDENGRAIAILGIDISAKDVYDMEKELNRRSLVVLAFGILISIILGFWVSKKTTDPVKKLEEATSRIAAGDLEYRVNIKGVDEISSLGDSFNNMAKSLSESKKALQDYFYRAVQSLVRSLEAKDSYTRGHSDRVAGFSEQIALEMGFSKEESAMLRKVAELHDIGKIGIDERILNKVEKLIDEEWKQIKEHPLTGEKILRPIFLDDNLLNVVKFHHERFDGKGYPLGIKGSEIDIFAQIVCVADSYDAMTSKRAYRDCLTKEVAISELKKNSGTQFNPRVVEAFLKVLERA